MRYTLLFLCYFVYIASSIAQLDSFNIADYARPNLERRTASINLNVNGGTNAGTFENRARRDGLDIRFGFSQSKFVNDEAVQIIASNYGTLYNHFSDAGIDADPLSVVDGGVFFRRNYSRKKFDDKKRFWEIAYNLRADISRTRYKEYEDNEIVYFSEQEKAFGVGISLYKGKGRVELITDAWHAKQILKSLEAKGLLKRPISSETIQEFAEQLSNIKNTRNTDFRLERIAEHEALSKYLLEADWTVTDDYRFFPTLLDAWDYEAFEPRYSGKEFKYGFVPGVSTLDWMRSYTSSAAYFIRYALAGQVAYNIYKPLSDEWQLNNLNSISIGTETRAGLSDVFNTSDFSWNSTVSTDWELQYLPNQRSYYSISGNLRWYESDRFSSGLYANLGGKYVHYFSPKFNIRVQGGLNFFNLINSFNSPRVRGNIFITTSYRFY